MKHTIRHILLAIASVFLVFGMSPHSYAVEDTPVYTTLRTIDLRTYNEYRYKMTEQFFNLREYFDVNGQLHVPTLQAMAVLADSGYKYLPDNLKNQNYLRELLIDIQRGVKDPANEIIYTDIISALADYLEKVEINSITGSIEASPLSGNAPLTTTFRAKVEDPSGTQISSGNYTWWIDNNGTKIVIGRGPSINYSFKEEGKFSIFLDVTSSHKNAAGYTDILPFRSKSEIVVNEKIASLVIKVNSDTVGDNESLKFNPDVADYGLLFDASSSIPTSGTKFSKTEWNFGNGYVRSYSGSPKVERVRYATQGDYEVSLRLTTNEGKVVEKYFIIEVHDPIATIEVNRADGYIGDSFTFSAKSSNLYRNLTYSWEVLNIDTDKVVLQKSDSIFTYNFTEKGRYNVQLKVRQSSGETDQDNRIVYVTSQSPIAEFETKIPATNKPNRVYFDASRSFDPDVVDDGKLKYDWFIDGNRVNLEQSNANGSMGYYVFDSVGTHSVSLEVTDPDGLTSTKKGTVQIQSILSVDFYTFPRVIPRNGFIKFMAESPTAQIYEWNFGDGKSAGGSSDSITHTYETSGNFEVVLKVSDAENNTNTYKRTVYVSNSNEPFSVLDVSFDTLEKPDYDASACGGIGGYVANRVQNINFNAAESINIDGQNSGLEYSWKIGQTKFSTSQSVVHRFDEIGCFPVKLTVKSKNNNATHTSETMVEIKNVLPTLASVGVRIEDETADPLVIRVTANGAQDPDGVIQSYMWYYYTDIDTQPQDFRSTTTSSTAFVIPKVTGNYYFMTILKDNNEARVTSEEITKSRYFTTITGDNINTPIVELSVSSNSTVLGEEIVFNAKASNILGQDISKDAEFSWDFDGDGFYDTQTKESSVSYAYKKSGEFYAKVKVKYRGISSTKNVTVNVSNKLVADFEYISIGNKFIFFDTSLGQIEDRQWDLGDGTKKTGTAFEYSYEDKASTHTVTLRVGEGTIVKEVQKDVSKNFKNILKARGTGIVVFTAPEVNEANKITLENANEKVFVYLGESTEDAVSYAIDYDIEYDSDLNGGMDDDANNKGTSSYVSGSVTEIPLSSYRIQKVRMYIMDESGAILGSEDIEIEKTYIEEVDINPDMIIFEGVTESEKQKIEALKEILIKLPQQQKLKSLSYVQKLQENWNDDTEKTRTILDFENYIFELQLSNENEIITLLESLLVEGQADQSAKQITYQALINLVPQDISCESSSESCYNFLLEKLDQIRNSDDIETNRTLGKEILLIIGETPLMTDAQKLDFKAILTSFVYGGNVEDIPTDEKQEVIDQTPVGADAGSGFSFLTLVLTILKWIGYIILFFIVLVTGFYLFYIIFNKDKSISFSQYVSKVTSGNDDEKKTMEGEDDILADFLEEPEKISDVFSQVQKDPLNDEKESVNTTPEKITEKKEIKEEVPDWLKGNFEIPKVENKPLEKKEEKTEQIQAKVPKQQDITEEVKKETVKQEELKIEKEEDINIEAVTKITSESNIPDWLKGSFNTSEEVKVEEIKEEESNIFGKNVTKDEENTSEETEVSLNVQEDSPSKNASPEVKIAQDDPQVPDWLKGSFDTPKDTPKIEVSKTEPKQEKKTVVLEKTEKKVSTKQKASSKGEQKTQKKDTTASKKAETKEELWDDGMKIPDWLKSDEE